MRLVSWNVAGIRACLKKGLKEFFQEVDADVFCIQESKATEDQFDFLPEGYERYLFPAVRKGYSGTVVYAREKPLLVSYGGLDLEYDEEGRMITLEYENFYLVNIYVPNVKRGLERMESRMRFEDLFRAYLKRLDQEKPVVVCGDFNVAHEEIDIRNAKQNIGNAGFTYEERGKFDELLQTGFIDTFRFFYPDKKDAYSWWSYRKGVREKNIGWRIDYFLVSSRLKLNIKDALIYSDVLGSDHCPIGLEIEVPKDAGITRS